MQLLRVARFCLYLHSYNIKQVTTALEGKWVWDLKIGFLHNLNTGLQVQSTVKWFHVYHVTPQEYTPGCSATSKYRYGTQYIYVCVFFLICHVSAVRMLLFDYLDFLLLLFCCFLSVSLVCLLKDVCSLAGIVRCLWSWWCEIERDATKLCLGQLKCLYWKCHCRAACMSMLLFSQLDVYYGSTDVSTWRLLFHRHF